MSAEGTDCRVASLLAIRNSIALFPALWYNACIMKKTILFLLVLCLCCTACGCGKTAAPAPTPTAAPTPLPELIPTTALPAEEHDEFTLYRDFLELNFVPLTTCCGFISGVGLADLDLDGTAELIVFDAGASSSMGVQFFDVINGEVECVSASRTEVGTLFAGTNFDKRHYVDAVDFSAFRLIELADGQLFFTASSMNGDDTLRFSERFRFGCREGALTLECLCTANSGYDPETGECRYTVYTLDDATLSEEEYAGINAALDSAADMGYTVSGCFSWESDSYGTDYPGVMAMFDAAAAAYVPAV